MRFAAAVLTIASLGLVGCAATYQQNVVLAPKGSSLERGRPVLIATPKSGFYGDKQYPASGRQTALAVQGAFAKYSRAVVSPTCIDVACLLNEGKRQVGYYVVPEILHWEDRNTEWSGIPDRVEVKLTVHDEVGKELASVVVTGKSKWATFGGDHPQDLLPEPIAQYVAGLY